MATIDKNFLSEVNFDFKIAKLKHIDYSVRAVVIPDISTTAPIIAGPTLAMKVQGDSLTFPPLTVRCQLRENMEDYFETYSWLTGITRAGTFKLFRDLISNETVNLAGEEAFFDESKIGVKKGYKALKSQGQLIIQNSQYIPNIRFLFKNLHPVSLGGFSVQSDSASQAYISYDIVFEYDYYIVASY